MKNGETRSLMKPSMRWLDRETVYQSLSNVTYVSSGESRRATASQPLTKTFYYYTTFIEQIWMRSGAGLREL